MKRLLFASLSAILLLIAAGCNQMRSDRKSEITQDSVSVKTETEKNGNCADSLIASLDDERIAAQFVIPAIYAVANPENMARIREYAEMGVCGIIFLKGDTLSVRTMADSLVAWSAIPPFVAIDAECGLNMRLHDASRYPFNGELPENISPKTITEYGCQIARQCRRLGINMVMGPVLDVAPIDSYIGKRSFGNDPHRVAKLGIAYASGLEKEGIISVAKHFPGHGAAQGDSHKTRPTIFLPLNELKTTHLLPFSQYIDSHLSAIMVGHLAFAAIDPDLRPAALSHSVITGLLRKDMGFDGLVITDALNMKGASGLSPEHALTAGADIILAPSDTRATIASIHQAIKKGDLTPSAIQSSLRRILSKKLPYRRP